MAMGLGRRVLVVDDDEGMREALKNLLDAAGFEAVAFASAEAFLRDAIVDGAVCLISDLRLPSMSGLEMLTALRARGEQIPVIAITAHDEPGVRDEAMRCGASAYLAKPFLGSALLDTISHLSMAPSAR
jgi:FixJ family two-component response regulator